MNTSLLAALALPESALFFDLGMVNAFFAAGLGSAFSTLWAVNGYVVARTFNPRYNSTYLVRFVLGLIAGLVLASIAPSIFTSGTTMKQFGPGLMALLGGYSAEAVNQILQRLVDVLLAAVKGGVGPQVEAREKAIKTEQVAELANLKGKGLGGAALDKEIDKMIKALR